MSKAKIKSIRKNIKRNLSRLFLITLVTLLASVLTISNPGVTNITEALADAVTDSFSNGNNINGATSSNFEVSDSQLTIDKNVNLGDGADGAIIISTDTSINTTNTITDRSCADGGDAVNYSVTALTSTTATLESSPASGCLVAGDEVLLINLRGITSASGNVGNFETLTIESVSSELVTFTTPKANYYGDGATDDTNIGLNNTDDQTVMLQRVPNYTNVTITGSGTDFSPDAWVQPTDSVNNGAGEGGIMFFRANGTVSVESGNTINANEKGYIKGSGGVGGSGGESLCGTGGVGGNPGGDGAAGGGGSNTGSAGGNGSCGGGGGAGASSSVGGTGSVSSGGSGGGGGRSGTTAGNNGGGGGGGGYGTAGGGSTRAGVSGGTDSSGNGGGGASGWGGGGGGGGTYGSADLSKLFFGSAGGGGGRGINSGPTNVNGVAGGNGGGIVFVTASTITVSGGIASNGQDGLSGGNNAGNGGGGAGGSVKLLGDNLTLGTSLITASGGLMGVGNSGSGGDAGVGRIRVEYLTSYDDLGTNPAASSAQATLYKTSATIQSTNLLSSASIVTIIDSFAYNLSALPAGTSATIQFSQDASTWYNSAGTAGQSNTLSSGSNSIDLSALSWSGANFYYKLVFSSDGTATPVLDEVSVNYSRIPTAPSTGGETIGGASATGGTITESGGYTFNTFTSSGTFTPNDSLDIEVLVVAGGGGGGSSIGGGGWGWWTSL